MTQMHLSRRQAASVLVSSTGAAFLGSTISSYPANADVSDGNVLPYGIQQFSKALRMQKIWKRLGNDLRDRGAEFDKKDWDNVEKILRGLYSTAEDMKVIAKNGIPDPDRKKEAFEIIAFIQKAAQAADVPTGKKDVEGLLVIQRKGEFLINQFFDLLKDVPDEI